MVPLPLLLTRLGRVVSSLRNQAGYSQDRFAAAVGVHRTYMGLLERGKANPTLRTLDLIAQRLGLEIADLLALATADADPAGARSANRKTGRPKPQGRTGARAGPER